MADFQFRTPINVVKQPFEISHHNLILTAGSCFSTHMGEKLKNANFKTFINPNGVLYNPLSIANTVTHILNKKLYSENELYKHHDLWLSFDYHGHYSNEKPDLMIERLNQEIVEANKFIANNSVLLITWGSAHVYKHLKTGKLAANCHKIPSKEFSKEMLSVSEIVTAYHQLVNQLHTQFPELKIVFTISPVRYLSDGFFENQLSKSILHLAAKELKEKFAFVSYFPAYEIMMDDLRDYRFYDSDLIHPSAVAVDYIWNCFSSTYFLPETQKLIMEIESIQKALLHRPFHTNSNAYIDFLTAQIQKINQVQTQHSELNLTELKNQFEERLSIIKP